LHIQKKQHEPTPEMQDLFRKYTELERTIKSLESLRGEIVGDAIPLDYSNGESLLDRIRVIESALEQKHQHLAHLEKEEKQAAPWGQFSFEMLAKLEQEELNLRFLICSIRKYQPQWELENCLEVVNDITGYRYFVKVERGEERNQPLDMEGVDEVKIPAKPLVQILDEINQIRQEIETLKVEMTGIAESGTPLLEVYARGLKSKLAEADAFHQTTIEVDGSVNLVEGWVPQIKVDELNAYLDAHKILSVSRKPDEDEQVPVLLKNNKFNKLFEFIGGFYDLPNHTELDLTPFFAPFYMMFFGFSLGDAGYGLVLILIATILKKKKPELRSVMTLAQFLGISTVVFGALTGTLFGINLIEAEIPWLAGVKSYMLNTDKLFYFALILGAIQI
jgi:V/A-type H+-transporting ATPase subunit I